MSYQQDGHQVVGNEFRSQIQPLNYSSKNFGFSISYQQDGYQVTGNKFKSQIQPFNNSSKNFGFSMFCDVKVQIFIIYISINERPYNFFSDLQGISYHLIGKGFYTNCSNKEPEEIKPNN
jgi:hypothetical protein